MYENTFSEAGFYKFYKIINFSFSTRFHFHLWLDDLFFLSSFLSTSVVYRVCFLRVHVPVVYHHGPDERLVQLEFSFRSLCQYIFSPGNVLCYQLKFSSKFLCIISSIIKRAHKCFTEQTGTFQSHTWCHFPPPLFCSVIDFHTRS